MTKFKSTKIVPCLAVLVTIVFICGSASALNIQMFRPKAVGNGTLHVVGSDTLTQSNFAFGFLYNYTHDLLDYSDIGLPSSAGIVKHLHTVDFLLAYGLTDWLTLHLDVPVHFLSSIDDVMLGGSNKDTGMGDLEFSLLLNLRKNMVGDERRIGFAVMPFMTTSTGNIRNYMREDGVSTGLKLIADYWMSKRGYVNVNIGFRFRPEERVNLLNVNDDFMYGVGYQRLLSEKMKLNFFTEVFGSTTFEDFASKENSSPIELVAGFKKGCSKHEGMTWVLGAGRGFLKAYGTPDIRVFAGMIYSPTGEKKEMPKVEPTVAPVITEEPKKEPVPPVVPEIKKGNLGLNIINVEKNKVESDVVITDTNGNVVESGKGSELTMALAPGKYNYEVKADGYRTDKGEFEIAQAEELKKEITLSPSAVVVTKEKIEVKQVIYFDTAKATIKDVSKPILDEVADVLKANPDIKKIRVEGYTDNTGATELNTKLSDQRAKSVADYVSGKGVDSARLDSKGFGPEKPIADNATKEGRAKNRRVEFVIVEQVQPEVKP